MTSKKRPPIIIDGVTPEVDADVASMLPKEYFSVVTKMTNAILRWHREHSGKICKFKQVRASERVFLDLDQATEVMAKNDNAKDLMRYVDRETGRVGSWLQFAAAYEKYKHN